MSDLPTTPPPRNAERLHELAAGFLALQAARQSNRALQAQLLGMRSSVSWRFTAPLRRLRAWLNPAPSLIPQLRPADAFEGGEELADPSELLRSRLGACALRAGPPAPDLKKLYVDVTELDLEDHGAGIQRVVRRVLGECLLEPPVDLRIEPVRLSAAGDYVHARAFLARLLGMRAGEAGKDIALTPRPGDRFLGLDLIRDRAALARPALERLRDGGVSLSFVVYDLLPVQHPAWFPPGVGAAFGDWLQMVCGLSTQLLCISQSVASELRARLVRDFPEGGPRVSSFPLGADVDAVAGPGRRRVPGDGEILRVLMVGTIEPRKGYEQAIAAFEQLWSRGHAVQLLIVGQAGWALPAFLKRLRSHPESNRRLRWLDAADDATVMDCYRRSDLLLAASRGEGYGLPLVEAAAQGLPILARDLPVFREVAGDGADYFHGDSAEDLAAALTDCVERWHQGRLANPARVPVRDWRSAAAQLQAELLKP